MKYGYTIADRADSETFYQAVNFIKDTLHYAPAGDVLEDVDGSLFQDFQKEGHRLRLESEHQIDYVAIISDMELPITCLVQWCI